jgi:1,4-alpha-glucan branching enzyme
MSPASARRRVHFSVKANPGSEVCVAGTFNDWAPRKHPLACQGEEGVYAARILVPKGRHEYKFVIDGVWCVDPACPDWAPNAYGSLNSVIEVA